MTKLPIKAELVLQQLERLLRQRNAAPVPQASPGAPESTQRGLLEQPQGIQPGETLLPLLGKGGNRRKVPAEKLQEEDVEGD